MEEGDVLIKAAGKTLLAGGMELNLWRAATDNDGIREWSGQEDKPLGQWTKAGLDRMEPLRTDILEEEEGLLVLKKTYQCAEDLPLITLVQTLSSREDGCLLVENEVTIPAAYPSLPRVGLVLPLSAGFEEVEWYGKGPQESYIDRDASAFVGLYKQSVASQFVPYILPQECGNHCGTRWMEISGSAGAFRVESDREFEFSALHHSAADLYGARHVTDLPERKETWLTLDLVQRGLGTGSCGPQTRKEYEVNPGVYSFQFLLSLAE